MSRQAISREIACAIHIPMTTEPQGQTRGLMGVPAFASGHETAIRLRCAGDIAPQHIDPFRIHSRPAVFREGG